MKRVVIALAMLIIALASIGVAVAASNNPTPGSGLSSSAGAGIPHKLMGYAGKIIAVKPPGDWTQGGGPAGAGRPPSLQFPFVLPVWGTDVHIANSNETFMAADPANPLYFISGSNGVSRDFSSDGGQTWTVTIP